MLVIGVMAGCANQVEKEINEGYNTVEIDNFNTKTKFEEVPKNVVVLCFNSAENLSALGVSKNIIGIRKGHNCIDDVLPEFRDALKDVPLPESINPQKGIPTLENMLNMEPDLIVTNAFYFNVKSFGTPDDYRDNGINLYITEGSYINNPTLENTYNDIMNLGKIFNVENKAEELVKKMRDKVEEITDKVKGKAPVKVLAFDSIRNGTFAVSGGTGLANYIIERAGGKNVFSDLEKQFGRVSLEDIIDRNPDVIVVYRYAIDGDGKAKVEQLKSIEGLSDVSAIKNNRIVIINLFSIFPGLQNTLALEQIAKGLHPDSF